MKRIRKDELYGNLGTFLKAKGIELKEGSYSQRIQKTCGLLTDAINLSESGLERAKQEIDRKLEQMRQVIHEKTAPKQSAPPAAAKPKAAKKKQPAPKAATKPAPDRPRNSRKGR